MWKTREYNFLYPDLIKEIPLDQIKIVMNSMVKTPTHTITELGTTVTIVELIPTVAIVVMVGAVVSQLLIH